MSADTPIPGRHNDRGTTPDEPYTMPTELPEDAATPRPARPTFQLMEHPQEDTYRIRSWTEAETVAATEDYDELGQYEARDALAPHMDDFRESHRFVVLENTDTGDVYVEREQNLTAFFDGGTYNQATFFSSEEAASAYANRQQEADDEQDG